jgi:pyrroloquinoline quinone (PQQ) biosynthesis protein C
MSDNIISPKRSPNRRWQYDVWFAPPRNVTRHPAVSEALRYASDRRIDSHPFFRKASKSKQALELWVSQELIVTGAFSQILLRVCAMIENVHVRTMVMEVVDGEHGPLRAGMAGASHPWLLHQLGESIGLAPASVQILAETEEFLAALETKAREPLTGVAAVGVGNERLILPEYAAVKRCFDACWPGSEYRAFLDANINDDLRHSELLADVGTIMIDNGADPQSYLRAAIESVDDRYHYYDRLLERV